MKPTQIKEEFVDWFCAIMRRENVRSYLEIGSKDGASLRMAAAALPVQSKLVSVDITYRQSLVECIVELRQMGHEVQRVEGDSTWCETVDEVALFAPFDCCFIDGNHLFEYVEQDFRNYSPMCRLVAFHDVGYRGEHEDINVPEFWNEIKGRYRHEELCLSPNSHGIGVLWV